MFCFTLQAIHIAAIRCNSNMIHLLLNRGADINGKGSWDLTPLHISLMRKNFDTTRQLLSEGADPNVVTTKGDTPLHVAIATRNINILKCLLEFGAHRKVFNKEGFTPLHIASMRGWSRGVEMLSSCGADTSITSQQDGYTSLNLASSLGNLRVVEALLDNRAEVNTPNSDGTTSLHLAIEKGNCRVAKTLMTHGADVNARDQNSNESVLHIAVRYCRIDIINALLVRGAYIDALTKNRQTTLHVLAEASVHIAKPETADLLLRKGAHLQAADKINRTAFYRAASLGERDLCLMLLAHGADTEVIPKRSSKNIPAYFFKYDGDSTYMGALIAGGCNLTAISHEMETFMNRKSAIKNIDLTEAIKLVLWIQEQITSPLSLKNLCRRNIREELRSLSEGLSLLYDIRRLPLSDDLKEYLLLKDLCVNVPLETGAAAADRDWNYKDRTMRRRKSSLYEKSN